VRTLLGFGRGGPKAVLASRIRRIADHVLDRGLDTGAPSIEPEHQHPNHAPYGPSAWHVLPRALRYVGVSKEDTFVDFGSGKGRVLHQAAKHPFRRVIGVEISPELAQAARSALEANKRRYRCRDVEIVVSDAADFRVPDDMTIAYLYNPFRDETLDAVLRNIVASMDRNPRLIRLIYVRPDQWERVLATGRFRLVKEQRNRFVDTSLSFVGDLSEVSIFEGR
jgi:cyclopropane fatty-acyl-phospholipid synthase-like methyltransferase